jgi:glycosyltransferase involved in cell wall biosynthesis
LVKRLSFWAIERAILKHAQVIHYTSEQERIEAEEGGTRTASTIIANPTDLEGADRLRFAGRFRARHRLPDKLKLVVFLSRLSSKKGLDLLIPAFARLHQCFPDTLLVIAGDGEQEVIGQAQRLVEEAGLSKDVLWTGFLQGDDKAAVLADAAVFVLPSYSENFGVAAVEALCFQVPVIVSDQVGIHREISKHQAGIVTPCDIAALADALIEIMSKPDLRSRMAMNARHLAEQRFSRRSILDSLLTTYDEVSSPACARTVCQK